MSDGSEFHRSDAATGKERRPTVVSQNGGTSSCCDDEERSNSMNTELKALFGDMDYSRICDHKILRY